MRKVMLATPSHDGKVEAVYANALVGTVKLCAGYGIELFPVIWPYEALVQHARNMLMALARQAEVDDVLLVDADQEWQPEAAVRLLSHEVQVVGLAVRRKEEAESYNVRSRQIPLRGAGNGLWLVDGIGTGFLRLAKSAIAALWDASESYAKNGQQTRMMFDVQVVNGQLVGEDVWMCGKLAALGIPIHLDPSFTVSHLGAKKYQGDFEAFVGKLANHHVTNER